MSSRIPLPALPSTVVIVPPEGLAAARLRNAYESCGATIVRPGEGPADVAVVTDEGGAALEMALRSLAPGGSLVVVSPSLETIPADEVVLAELTVEFVMHEGRA